MEKDVASIKSWLASGSINLFGLPFAGKDTQCHDLAGLLDATILSGGEILRKSAPPELMRDTNAGKLFPTKEFVKFVTPYLSGEEFSGRPLILSSVGRWHGEEPGILQAAEASGHPIKAVIYLKVDEAVARVRHARLEIATRGQRSDDAPELLAQRFYEFKDKTLPVIDFYRAKGLLVDINADGSSAQVTKDVLRQLAALAKRTARLLS